MRDEFQNNFAGAILSGALASTGAQAATFGDLYAFGDSLNDCCNNVQAPFTNGDETWLVELADAIGATYDEATTTTNYATGGAQSGDFNAIFDGSGSEPVYAENGLQSQIDQFQLDAPEITSDDLAVIWVGTNDIWASSYVADQLLGIPTLDVNKPLGLDPTAEALAEYIAGNIQTAITDLE